MRNRVFTQLDWFAARPGSTMKHLLQGAMIFGLITAMFFSPAPVRAATFTVTTIEDIDDGICDAHCTLREAINLANSNPGPDTITFNLVGGAPFIFTIDVSASELPALIDDGTTIDGTTNPGYSGAPMIDLTWTGDPLALASGLRVQASNITIRGLSITGWHKQIRIEGATVTNTLVEDNYVGLRTDGVTAASNGLIGIAVWEGATATQIRNNVISAHQVGIQVSPSPSVSPANTLIEGNHIGTDASATAAIGNLVGVAIFDSLNTTLRDNVISGNSWPSQPGEAASGVFVNSATNVIITGNKIGTDGTGSFAITNDTNGITIWDGIGPSTGVVIGGPSSAQRNIISGNNRRGVWLSSSSDVTIQGNYIGTDASGSIGLGNGLQGIRVEGGAANLIGGPNPGEGNVISANGSAGSDGIFISGSAASGNVIEGNRIGTDVSGTAPLGNTLWGIFLSAPNTSVRDNVISNNGGAGILIQAVVTPAVSSTLVQGNVIGADITGTVAMGNGSWGLQINAPNTIIGGALPGQGNVIAFNTNDGVLIQGNHTGNAIHANSIFDNGGLGINLVGLPGVDPNDPGDPDSGPNGLQNYPLLTGAFADPGAGSTLVAGSLNSTPGTQFRVEVFSQAACDPSGHGEGAQFLTGANVTTDATGNTTFGLSFPFALSAGDIVTATATDPAGSTSEFSACIAAVEVTAAALTGELIDNISLLVDDSVLNKGQGNSLTSKAQQALHQIERNNKRAAINQFGALINQLNALVQGGALTAEQGQSLAAAAGNIIALLGGG